METFIFMLILIFIVHKFYNIPWCCTISKWASGRVLVFFVSLLRIFSRWFLGGGGDHLSVTRLERLYHLL